MYCATLTSNLIQKIELASCSILPATHCRRKAGLRAEITLDGLDLFVCDAEIFHVPERFTVLGQAKILDKCIVAVSDHPLQFKPFDKIDLGFPASRLENAFADVVVTVRARKGEIVGKQGIDGSPVLLLPCRVPLPDDLLFCRTQPCLCVRACDSR